MIRQGLEALNRIDWHLEQQIFWSALMFYTRIPVPHRAEHTEAIFNQSRKYFPLIGVIVGGAGALVLGLATLLLPLSTSLLLSMVATLLLTGAFHEDGFADSCDGFGGGWDKTQVLTIMKDSRLGTYGSVGLLFILALKFSALYEIGQLSMGWALLILINGHTLSRLTSGLTIEWLDYVQDIDASKVKPMTTQNLTPAGRWVMVLIAVPGVIGLLLIHPSLLFGLMAIPMGLLTCGLYFRKRIGGYTGDCLGAMQQLTELLFYLLALGCLGRLASAF